MLVSKGPNDGLTLLRDVIAPNSLTIIELGSDHFFAEDPKINAKTIALTILVISYLEGKKHSNINAIDSDRLCRLRSLCYELSPRRARFSGIRDSFKKIQPWKKSVMPEHIEHEGKKDHTAVAIG